MPWTLGKEVRSDRAGGTRLNVKTKIICQREFKIETCQNLKMNRYSHFTCGSLKEMNKPGVQRDLTMNKSGLNVCK